MSAEENRIEQAGETPTMPDRIVSVNDYGSRSTGLGRKLALVTLLLVVFLVGAVFSVNRYFSLKRARDAKAAQAEQEARRDSPPAKRRQLASAPTAVATAVASPAAALPAEASAVMGTDCPDQSRPEPMLDHDGQPVLAPNGLPVRLCANGQILMPPLAPPQPRQAAATPASTEGATRSAGPAPAAKPASRYDGELLLPAPPSAAAASGAPPAMVSALAAGAPASTDNEAPPAHPQGRLRAMLRSTPNKAARASLLGNRDLILPEGRSIDCNLSLRIISDISGKAVCVLSSYVYGDSGMVVLAEPGSIVTGDYLALSAAGQRRLFIAWNRLKTSQGVVIDLDSPAADALGTSGLDGYLDQRWGDRIGAAVLLSLVEDTIAYETARAGSGGGTTGVAVFPQTSQAGKQLAERILDSTINIKPTLYKHQGDRASITVARDLDFGDVYALHTK